ncbi:MAG: hypothetical protein NUV46_02935 [Nanoarchaeota archaeon]|nr:hypothetical protein [Nanoarchaeota archaeon]
MKKLQEKKGWADYLIYVIWAFILFTGIWDLFHIPGRAVFWFAELILAIIIYYKIKMPKGAYFGILALFLANLFGELFFGFFYIIPEFDKILHLISPFAICTIFYFLFKRKTENKKLLILLSVSVFLSIELFWEVIEYLADTFFHTTLAGVHAIGIEKYESVLEVMPKYEDTIYDMVLNLIGSVIWAVIALFVTKTKKPKKRAI